MHQMRTIVPRLARAFLSRHAPHTTGSNLKRRKERTSSLWRIILRDTFLHLRQKIRLNERRNITALCFCNDEAPSPNTQHSNTLPRQIDYTLRRWSVRIVPPREDPFTNSLCMYLFRRPDSLNSDRLGARYKRYPTKLGSIFSIFLQKIRTLEIFSQSCQHSSKT